MNKRNIIRIFVTLFALLTVLCCFAACTAIISLQSVELVCKNENATYEIDAFKYDDYSLLLTYSDETQETIPVTESMISDYDKVKLKSPGKQTITVKYENKTVEFSVTVKRKQVETEGDSVAPYLRSTSVKFDGKPHSLTVEGDVPEGATVLYPNGNSFTKAGMYPVTATIQSDGYETIVLTAMLTIEKSIYAFDNFAIVADYGTAQDGTPATSFVYDGQGHGVETVGSYPPDLGSPSFRILNTDVAGATYRDGYTATDAGHYHVVATFEGDADNYFTDNLTYECDFEISKKPISMEILNAISFTDQQIDYDAKPHRIDIGNVELPTGISVGYYTSDGVTPFGTRTDVGEYDIICKFQSDNPNLKIINELQAHLSIQQVNYVNVDLLHIAFLDESTELTYDGTAHDLKVFGLNKNVTVKKFVWNKSTDPAEDVEITSLTDVLVNDNAEVTSYRVTAYFNTPADPNHKAVEPIRGELTIHKAAYVTPEYVFDSVEAVYNENETFSLSFTETVLPAGMKTQLCYTVPGKADVLPGLPSVTCLPYDAENPKQNCGVGVYTCTLTFDYNPNNYVDAPASLTPVIRTLNVGVRTYDAADIITVKNVRTEYALGVNQLSLCRFNEALPDWVNDVYLTLAVLENTEDEIFEATETGTYAYFFRFSYFNGKETVTADSKRAELKIVGLPIYDRYYSVTYGTAFTYDGVTDCLPTAVLSDEVADVLTILCTYTFAKPGSTEFETVYTGAGDTVFLAANADCLAAAKRAGTHKFVFTMEGANFEPLTVSVTLTVNPKKLEISHTTWILTGEATTVTYDGTDHSDAYVFAGDPPAEEKAVVTLTPKLLASDTKGQTPGVDVGEYTYTLLFTAEDKNYYIEAEDESYFTYKVKILPLALTYDETSEEQPAGFFYVGADTAERFLLSASAVTSYYTSASPLYDYVKTYGILVSEGCYTMPQWSLGEHGFSGYDLQMFYRNASADSAEQRAILRRAFCEDSTVVVLRPDGTTATFNGLASHTLTNAEDVTDDLCSAIDASASGEYVVTVILNSENVTFGGSRIFAFHIAIKALQIEPNDVLDKASAGVFGGFGASSIPVTEERNAVAAFQGLPLFAEDTGWYFTGGCLSSDLFGSVNAFDKEQMQKATSYILYCDLNGNVLKFDGFHTVFAFDPLDADQLKRPGETFTQTGYYYLFIDLGANAVVKQTDGQVLSDLHRFVVRIKVNPYDVSASDLVTLKDGDGQTVARGADRLYQTDAATVTYKYGASAIAGVDTVSGTDALAGMTVRTFETLYNGKRFGLTLLPTLPAAMKNNVTFTVKVVSYAFAAGGAELSTALTYANSGLSYEEVAEAVKGLYATESAKTKGVSSVGLYYVFLTVEGDDLLCGGEKTVIVTVKIDRRESESMYKYTFDTNTYDLRSENALPKSTLTWQQATAVTVSDALKAQIKAQTGVGTIQNSTIASPAIGSNSIHVKFSYDVDEYGGLTLEGDYVVLEVTKVNVNLSNLTPLGTQTFCQSSVNGQTITNTLKNKIKAQLVTLGMAASDASMLADRIFSNYSTTYSPYTNAAGTASYVKISSYGEYLFTPTFHLATNDTILQKYTLTAGKKFTQSGNTFTPDNSYCCYLFVDSTTSKGKLFVTQGDSTNWYSTFEATDDVTDPVTVVKKSYAFIGFYTETGNDFYNSLLCYMTEAEADAWIQSHVTVTVKSNYMLTVTVNLGTDASKYDLYINTWTNTGVNPSTGKAVGKLTSCTKSSQTVFTATVLY